MDPNSSISNSKANLGTHVAYLIAALLGVFWLMYFVGSGTAATYISSLVGTKLVRASRGRISDPVDYIDRLLYECVVLVTVALLVFGVLAVAKHWLSRKLTRRWAWLPLGMLAFVGVNCFFWRAAETNVFWVGLFSINQDSKQPGFHIKRLMFRDDQREHRVLALGSSQAGSEIDEIVLAEELGDKVNAATLSYAGSQTQEFVLVRAWCRENPPDVVIVYLSELNLFTPVSGARLLPLMKLSSLPDVFELRPWEFQDSERLRHGFLAALFPTFQTRRSVEYAVFGTDAVEPSVSLKRKRGDVQEAEAEVQSLDNRADRFASDYGIGPWVEYHQRALELFIEDCKRDGTSVFLVAGQISPAVSDRLDPQIRQDFLRYVQSLPDRYEHVICLREGLVQHPQEDYEDLMHVTEDAQRRFTVSLANQLKKHYVFD